MTASLVPVAVSALLAHPSLAPNHQVCAGASGLARSVAHARVQKSGLVFAGHLAGMDPKRVQIVGETEQSYLRTLTPEACRAHVAAFFGLAPALTVVTRGAEPHPELVREADRTGSPLVVLEARSSDAIQALHGALDELLAPRETVHGNLVEIHGMGTLLLGPSGIGKSECALFLVERGHRLVADDRVRLTRPPRGGVHGGPEPLLRHHMEIRGLGILDIRDLYGATAVRDEVAIELVVELCAWEDAQSDDRLGIDDVTHALLGVPVPLLRIPIRPGREMATLLEVAARNEQLKRRGRHGARAFLEGLARARTASEDAPESPSSTRR
jgi:HPr kinase/phosphorylase